MKAIVYHRSSSGETLKLKEIEKPRPADDEVLIKVHAASVNPFDSHTLRHSLLRRVVSSISKLKVTRPGRDVAGQVEAIGRNITQFKVGDEVFGTCNGAFAEYACGRESAFAIKPPNVSFEQAASLPIAGLTALQGLRDKARIQPDQKILINGASGGVGTFAVQIAKTLGAEVTGVCSTKNLEMVRSIGANRVIDYTQEDFTSQGRHYGVIFDLVANHSFSQLRRALTRDGIYIGAGVLGIDSMMKVLTDQITTSVRSPFVSQKFQSLMARLNQKDLADLASLVAEGKVRPIIDRRFALNEVPDAVHYLELRHTSGKVIINVDQAR
jgi:NADPH:quinone reductase-like Zn-dependent oxidoreductase